MPYSLYESELKNVDMDPYRNNGWARNIKLCLFQECAKTDVKLVSFSTKQKVDKYDYCFSSKWLINMYSILVATKASHDQKKKDPFYDGSEIMPWPHACRK